jgi:2-oxoglutarate ferredoxin oxidoreductase subunit alpha
LKREDFIIRFAGEGGQGMVTSADGLAQAASMAGFHVQTFSTFPSQILGGPTWTQTRISTTPVRSSGDDIDVLVCFNREAYDNHKSQVRDDGVIIYNTGDFELDSDGKSFGLPFEELAKSTGNARAENMVVIGAFAHLVNMPQEYLDDFVTKRFTRGRTGDDEIIRSNIEAMNLGRAEAASSGFSLAEMAEPKKPDNEQILIKGNEAVSAGALAAGINFFVGYPISPATPILIAMERCLVGENQFAYQASSEIEAINAIIGGSYTGKKAMTATSGPGLSLMSEAIGMAWMTEVPFVIVNVQRGGPATGLPTKTEQSDFQLALHPAHGDSALPVIAAGTVEECFYATVAAFNWAERYQGPVILLSEMMLAERAQNIPRPDLDKLKVENRDIYKGPEGYLRYEAKELSPMPLPGTPGSYIANASEHDPYGDTTHLAERHIHMMERRFSKLKLLEDGEYESKDTEASVAIMPWGGSKGPSEEAYELILKHGKQMAWYYTMFLHPLPAKLLEELLQKDLVIVPELNFQGQFSGYLRSLGVKAESITQYTGLPFNVEDLAQRIEERLGAGTKGMVNV